METDAAVQAVGGACQNVKAALAVLDDAVVAARAAGATWSQIGMATGMSRQSAHERWGHIPRAGCQRGDCDCVDHVPGDCVCGHGPGRGLGAGRRRAAGAR